MQLSHERPGVQWQSRLQLCRVVGFLSNKKESLKKDISTKHYAVLYYALHNYTLYVQEENNYLQKLNPE